MVKGRSKMIYLENDVLDDLEKEDNMSKVVNEVLREHYRKQHIAFMTPEERAKYKKTLQLKMKLEQDLKEIEDGL